MAANVTPLRKPEPATREPGPASEPLWREVLGSRLRQLRRERGEKLTETAGRAGISPQYLSEVERGRKEPSSEMIAALAGAFGLTLIDLTTLVIEDLRRHAGLPDALALHRTGPRGAQGVVSQEDRCQPPQQGLRPPGPVALLSMAA